MDKVDKFLQEEAKKKPVIKRMIESGKFTKYEILYYFPNNYLRHHGLPARRGGNKKRSKKIRAKNFVLFEIIEKLIEETIGDFFNKPFYQEFVEVKNCNLGDKATFQTEPFYIERKYRTSLDFKFTKPLTELHIGR